MKLRAPCRIRWLTLGRSDADRLELLGMGHRKHNRLAQLLDLLSQATNVTVLLGRLLIDLHRFDAGVVPARVHANMRACPARTATPSPVADVLRGQLVQYQVCVLVGAHQVGWLQRIRLHQPDDGQEHRLWPAKCARESVKRGPQSCAGQKRHPGRRETIHLSCGGLDDCALPR